MIRRPPRSTLSSSSAASDVYKRQSALRVVRRCADLAELLAAAAAGLGRVVVLSADLPELDREGVARLRGVGAAVVAIVDVDSDWQEERMEALGATLVVRGDRTAEEIADGVEDLARDLTAGLPLAVPVSHAVSPLEQSAEPA